MGSESFEPSLSDHERLIISVERKIAAGDAVRVNRKGPCERQSRGLRVEGGSKRRTYQGELKTVRGPEETLLITISKEAADCCSFG